MCCEGENICPKHSIKCDLTRVILGNNVVRESEFLQSGVEGYQNVRCKVELLHYLHISLYMPHAVTYMHCLMMNACTFY